MNGVSERMIRTITEKARSMISSAKLSKTFWGEAVLTATYLINRSPSRALQNIKKTPFEMWHNKKPVLKYLKIFGSTVYALNKVRKRKFDEKSIKVILVGYEPNGYKLWNEESRKFMIARDVVVDETNMLKSRNVHEDDSGTQHENVDETRDSVITESEESGFPRVENNETVNSGVQPSENSTNPENADPVIETGDKLNENVEEKELRRSERNGNKPKLSYRFLEKCLMNAQLCLNDIPNTFEEIQFREDKRFWDKAIEDELNSHFENNTWCLVQKPENKNIVDCKWVFSKKQDEFGNLVKYKARLVARGFTQEYMTDYDETFAPVARVSSFRFLLALSNQFNLLVHHMDVKTAFLNGTLKEEIYMMVPKGLTQVDGNKVCKLNKAIYGLKQAARRWFEVFEKVLKEIGFENLGVDRCIYILNKGHISKNIFILLYVDDVVIATENSKTMSNFKSYLFD